MRHWPQSSVLAGMTCGAIFLLGCGAGSGGPPPADDAFLSYLQAADGLARTLLHPPPSPSNERPAQLAAACLELAKLQAAAEELEPEEIRRLAVEHAEVVRQAKQSWEELWTRHQRAPSFPGPEWPDYERAFVFCSRIARP